MHPKSLLVAAALTLIANGAAAAEALALEKTYESDVIHLFERVFVYDGAIYSAVQEGGAAKYHLERLDLVTGDHTTIKPSVATYEFRVDAVSDKYVLALEGELIRISIYDKANWKRLGSVVLREAYFGARIDGDTLYLLQAPGNSLSVTSFALPSLKFVKEVVVWTPPLPQTTRQSAYTFAGNSVVVANQEACPGWCAHIVKLDLEGRVLQEARFNGTRREGMSCGPVITAIDDRLALLGGHCGGYAVLDLDTLASGKELQMGDAAFAGAPIKAGKYLYAVLEWVFFHRAGEKPRPSEVTVFDLDTGARLDRTTRLVGGSVRVHRAGGRYVVVSRTDGAKANLVSVYRPLPP